MAENIYPEISKEKFKFVDRQVAHDLKLDTKPVGFFRDAMRRFAKNKGSVVAFGIIIAMVLFAIIVPLCTEYQVSYEDATFKYMYPKSHLAEKLGWDFWDGCTDKQLNFQQFNYFYQIGVETGHKPIKNNEYTTVETLSANKKTVTMYQFRLNSYYKAGVIYMNVKLDEFAKIQQYQDEAGVQVIYPITNPNLRPTAMQDKNDANYWYKTTEKATKTQAVVNDDGSVENIYLTYEDYVTKFGTDDGYTSKMRIEGEGDRQYAYSYPKQGGVEIRVDYYEYYIYNHVYVLKDGITEPHFVFGTTAAGKDILTCLASGARFSFLFAIAVCAVNMFVGTIYGAVEGYYGGTADIVMERISDILAAIPTMIVITLLKLHMQGTSQILILFIAFFATGWIGDASLTRMQFYRFKNQEYVLAARTLGAKDMRIMFKHIFPNSLGTIITSSILAIPGMIFSESSLSYLGIINLDTGNTTSVGTLLAAGQPYLTTYPYMILFPSIFISLLMLSFNLFGNGLRDAFNPSLRGAED